MTQDPSVRLVSEDRLGVVQLELQSTSGQSSTADLTLVRITAFDAVTVDDGKGSIEADLTNHGIRILKPGTYEVHVHCPFTTMANGGDRNAMAFVNASDTDLASGWPAQSKWVARDEYVTYGTASSTNETETVKAHQPAKSFAVNDFITAAFLQHRREGSGSSTMIIGEDPGQRVSLTVRRIS